MIMLSEKIILLSWRLEAPSVVKRPNSFERDLIKAELEYQMKKNENTTIITSQAIRPTVVAVPSTRLPARAFPYATLGFMIKEAKR